VARASIRSKWVDAVLCHRTAAIESEKSSEASRGEGITGLAINGRNDSFPDADYRIVVGLTLAKSGYGKSSHDECYDQKHCAANFGDCTFHCFLFF